MRPEYHDDPKKFPCGGTGHGGHGHGSGGQRAPVDDLLGGAMIEPLKMKGNESVADFIDNVFAGSGYNARRLGEACKTFAAMIDGEATIGLTVAGAMTPIGMSGPIIALMEAGFVDWIVSTGANLYHDLHRPFDCPVRQGDFRVDDNDLYEKGVVRIYDTFIDDEASLLATDRLIVEAAGHIRPERPLSTAELHRELARQLRPRARWAHKSFVLEAERLGVPIYTSSPGDSSIGMNMIIPHYFDHPVPVDPWRDVVESAAIVRDGKLNGVVELGGGSPKNFFLQTQPTLWQILQDSRGGHDFFVQFTSDAPHFGGLSGATPSEAKSWGKVKDAVKNNVVAYVCSSIGFPLLAQYALMRCKPRKHRRLLDRIETMFEDTIAHARQNKKLAAMHPRLAAWANGRAAGASTASSPPAGERRASNGKTRKTKPPAKSGRS